MTTLLLRKTTMESLLFIDVHNGCRREAVKIRAARGRIGTDILAVEIVAGIHVRQLLGKGDGVQRVACWSENRANLQRSLLEALEAILTVIEDYAAEGVVNAIVQIEAEFAAT